MKASNRNPRVLVSAYACEPHKGSEPGAGFEWTKAAAAHHDVTLLTRSNNVPALDGVLPPNVRIVGIDLPQIFLRLKPFLGTQFYYALWQIKAAVTGRRLNAESSFDVVHHLTFASDWFPPGVFAINGPRKVWGPIGGKARWPVDGIRWLGVRGFAGEARRQITTAALRASLGRYGRIRADVMIAQNPVVQAYLSARVQEGQQLTLQPNVVVEPVDPGTASHANRSGLRPRVVSVARLEPLKALPILIESVARLEKCGQLWDLIFVGSGPDRSRLEKWAREVGISERVVFLGQVSRSEVLDTVASSDVFVSTCMREAAGFALAEALTLGVPSVYLDTGGPTTIGAAGPGHAVSLDGPDLPHRVATAILTAKSTKRTPTDAWSPARLPRFLARVYSCSHSEVG